MAFDYDEFIATRIRELRTRKGDSGKKVSIALGHDPSYLGNIENKRNLPSISQFHKICAYFGITPEQFYRLDLEVPELLNEIVEDYPKLDAGSQQIIIDMMRKLKK